MKRLLVLSTALLALVAAGCAKKPEATTSPAPQGTAPTASPQAGGGTSEALSALLGAPDTAAGVGTFKMDFRFLMSGLPQEALAEAGGLFSPGSGGEIEFMSGHAEIDEANEQAAMTFNVAFGGKMEMVQDGADIYLRMPMFGDLVGAGDKWIKMSVRDFGSGDLTEVSGGSSQNPAEFVNMLRGAGAVEEVGTEEVRGEQATHYRAEVDLAKVVANAPPEERAQVEASLAQLKAMGGVTTIPIDAWVNADGLPVRLRFAFDMSQAAGIPDAGVPEGVAPTMTMDMEMYDYGAPVTVEVPPPSQVEDFSQLEDALGTMSAA